MLENFFQPLDPLSLLLFLLIIILLHSLGFWIAKILNLPEDFQVLFWIFGLSIYILIIFVVHYFFPIRKELSWLILLAISIIPTYNFFIQKKFISLIKKILSFPFAFLAIIPLLKQFFFLLSKPPERWDELHYHFFSPAKMLIDERWEFLIQDPPYIFSMLPRFLSTAYTTMFSLTNTYATAQLLHFFLFLSSLTTIGILLRKKIKTIPSILFIVSTIYFYPELLQNSTQGYVDAGLATIVVILLLLATKLLTKPDKNLLTSISVLSGLAISIKYNAVISLIGIGTSILCQIKTLEIRKLISKKMLLSFFATLFIFGGYWYLKNAIVTYNPIYPYFFSCKNNMPCGKNAPELLDQYTLHFNIDNYQEIINQITFENSSIFSLFIICFISTIFLSYLYKNDFIFKLSISTAILIIIEIIINNLISGYQNRFFYHWNILISLYIAIPISFISFTNNRKAIMSMIIIAIYIPFLNSLNHQLMSGFERFKNPGFYTGEDILFARKRIGLDTWLSYRYPENFNIATEFCNSKDRKTILIADKYTYHLNYNGFIRAFFTNCQVIYLPVSADLQILPKSSLEIKKQINHIYPDSYIFTLLPCDNNREIYENNSHTLKEKFFSSFASAVACEKHVKKYPNLYKL